MPDTSGSLPTGSAPATITGGPSSTSAEGAPPSHISPSRHTPPANIFDASLAKMEVVIADAALIVSNGTSDGVHLESHPLSDIASPVGLVLLRMRVSDIC